MLPGQGDGDRRVRERDLRQLQQSAAVQPGQRPWRPVEQPLRDQVAAVAGL